MPTKWNRSPVAVIFLLLFYGATLAMRAAQETTRYLAFQIFTGGIDSAELRQSLPQSPDSLLKTVEDIRGRVYVPAAAGRRLGFIAGPLSFDNTDEEIRKLIAASFTIALQTDVAVGFHIDDSMFWGRLKSLSLPGNVEWLDWSGKPGTGRRLDWSSKPLKIMPQLCLNSRGVTEEVRKRAALIGDEVQKGLRKLHDAGRDDIFIGVIAGWETQIGRDFATGKPLGYCALTNKGFSATHPPADFERARSEIVREFVALWAQSLAEAGIPKDKIYSHIAFMSESQYRLARRVRPDQTAASYLEAINATPPEVAFSPFNHPGFSTYPQPGHLEQLRDELAKHGNPPWASSEGTAIDPAVAEQSGPGRNMEGYLGNLFNHGARLVNIFGWGVGDQGNPFRKVAEEDASVAAYRKFLKAEVLQEDPMPAPEIPSAALPEKMRIIERGLPAYVDKNGPARVASLMQRLDEQIKQQRFAEAEKTADEVLPMMK
ncbi:MAG: hypothetical protein ABSG03_17370 [Bryobacteraceae bacterium]